MKQQWGKRRANIKHQLLNMVLIPLKFTFSMRDRENTIIIFPVLPL